MSNTISYGFAYNLITNASAKLLAIITQIVLGWYLTKEEFGLYALVLSLSFFMSALRNGGAERVLVQRGDEFNLLAPLIFRFSLIFNVVSFILIFIVAIIFSNYFDSEKLFWLLLIIGASGVISTPCYILISKIQIDHKFKFLAKVNLLSVLARQGSMIVLALLGFGVYSFVFPLIIESLVIILAISLSTNSWPNVKKLVYQDYKNILDSSKWIMLSSFATAVILNGNFFIINWLEGMIVLGVYFFANQLVMSLSVIFVSTMEQVVFPWLSKKVDPREYNIRVISSLNKLIYFILPVITIAYIYISPVIEFIWQGKWNESIDIAKILLFLVPTNLLNSFFITILQSKGMWPQRLFWLCVYALGNLIVSFVFLYIKDIYAMTIALVVFQTVLVLSEYLYIFYIMKLDYKELFKKLKYTVLYFSISLLIMCLIINISPEIIHEQFMLFISVLIFSCIYMCLPNIKSITRRFI